MDSSWNKKVSDFDKYYHFLRRQILTVRDWLEVNSDLPRQWFSSASFIETWRKIMA